MKMILVLFQCTFTILGTTFSNAFKKDIGSAKGLENFALGEMLVLPQTFGLVFPYLRMYNTRNL